MPVTVLPLVDTPDSQIADLTSFVPPQRAQGRRAAQLRQTAQRLQQNSRTPASRRIADRLRDIAATIPASENGSLTYFPGGAIIQARVPLGTVAIMCSPDARTEDIAVNLAAALAAGNAVAVGLISIGDLSRAEILSAFAESFAEDDVWVLGADRRGWKKLGTEPTIVAISAAGVRIADTGRDGHPDRLNVFTLIHRYSEARHFEVMIESCSVTPIHRGDVGEIQAARPGRIPNN